MNLILKLLLAHILGDFVFQPKKWVKSKEERKHKSKYLYWHIIIHFLTLIVVLKFDLNYWLGILIILISHYIIDLSKLYFNTIGTKRWLFFIDQLFHFAVLFLVVRIYEKEFLIDLSIFYSSKFLLLIISVFLVTIVSSVFMKVIISKWELKGNSKKKSLKDAGKYIGILERLIVFVFIAINQWSGVGFLLAAKSIFRFGDLTRSEDRKLTEYILIGTLLSFGLAILIGLGYSFLLDKI